MTFNNKKNKNYKDNKTERKKNFLSHNFMNKLKKNIKKKEINTYKKIT